jgi:hypothetical protein
MEEYLERLDEKIKEKGLRNFCVFPDLKTFKVIKKTQKQMVEIMKKNPEKYAGRHLAVVFLHVDLKRQKTTDSIFADTVFTTIIDIFEIYDDGDINKVSSGSWRLHLKYRPDDIINHPFKIKNLQKMINWTYNKKIESYSIFGMYYDEFEDRIKRLQKVYKKMDYTLD